MMRNLLLLVQVFGSLQLVADSETIWRIYSFQALSDGKYSVLCIDGSLEKVEYSQLMKGEVCGKAAPAFPEGSIRGAIRDGEDMFLVKCVDGSTERISIAKFSSGLACFKVGKKILGGVAFPSHGTPIVLKSNTLYLYPFSVKKPTSVIGFGVRTVRTKDPQVVVGIYGTNKEGNPDKLIVQTEEMDVVGSETYLTGVTATKLQKGTYYLAFQSNGSVSVGKGTRKTKGITLSVPYNGALPPLLGGLPLGSSQTQVVSVFAVGTQR